jgi:hypothetical protein
MIKLGYSIGDNIPGLPLSEQVKILSSIEKDAVEVGYVIAKRLKIKQNKETIDLLRSFNYVSVHAPALVSDNKDKTSREWIDYPSSHGEEIVEQILEIADLIDADTILFHPDLVEDFDWLSKKVGDRLAFENMDDRKKFGKTVEDMEKVFEKVPNAKWVCDVNHIYTNDRTMKSSEEFHKAFADRLCHYHISGYGDFHDCFYRSKEDIILTGIKDLSIPLINEGIALREGEISLRKEHDYILTRLDRK